jgi:hypothetical protein
MGQPMNAMISIGLVWIAWIVAISGIGYLTLRLFRQADLPYSPTEIFWVGFASLIAILQIWHLFARIDVVLTIIVLCVGGIGCISFFRSPMHPLDRYSFHLAGLFAAIAVPITILFFIWLTNRAIGNIQPYDAGLYHLQTIRWIQTYPIVPGLGNLHARLAFNSSFLLFLSLLDVGPWIERSFHIGMGLLLLIASLPVGENIIRALVHHQKPSPSAMIRIIMITPLALLYYSASSTSTDMPIFILGIIWGVSLFRMVMENSTPEEQYRDAFLVTILCALSVVIKSSFLVPGMLVILLALGILAFPEWKCSKQIPFRQILTVLIPVCVLILVWMTRGIILSGYPLFPLDWFSFPVPWKISQELVAREARSIMAWARAPGHATDGVLANFRWVFGWARRMSEDIWNLIVPVTAFALFAIFFYFLSTRNRLLRLRWFLLSLPMFIGLAFWFFSAPDPRFAGVSFWLLASFSIAFCYRQKPTTFFASTIITGAFLLAFIEATQIGFWTTPGPDHGLYPAPQVGIQTFQTSSGLVLYVPIANDQCWNAPLPCTPYPNSLLRLGESDNLGSGFFLPPAYP